jgi:CheY-like chemotaxis protein
MLIGRARRTDLSNTRIILVDDDENFRALTRMALEVRGLDVDEADSAPAALELIELSAPNGIRLVLADHRMPGMTGAEMAEALAQTHPQLPVQVWSSFPDLGPGIRRKSLESLDSLLDELQAS